MADYEDVNIATLIRRKYAADLTRALTDRERLNMQSERDALVYWLGQAAQALYEQRRRLSTPPLSKEAASKIALDSAQRHKNDADSKAFPPSWVIDAIMAAGLVHPDDKTTVTDDATVTDDDIRELYNGAIGHDLLTVYRCRLALGELCIDGRPHLRYPTTDERIAARVEIALRLGKRYP